MNVIFIALNGFFPSKVHAFQISHFLFQYRLIDYFFVRKVTVMQFTFHMSHKLIQSILFCSAVFVFSSLNSKGFHNFKPQAQQMDLSSFVPVAFFLKTSAGQFQRSATDSEQNTLTIWFCSFREETKQKINTCEAKKVCLIILF